ncbi:MAG: BspA family leucine-rich repeat surface protein [Bacilli bacterium]
MKIKKKYLILIVITLLVSVGTLTYAYFEGTILNDLINRTIVSTGSIDVEISDNVVNADNVKPIYNGSINYEDATFKKKFTVTNSGMLNTCIDLYLKVNTIDDALISTDFRYMVINDETGTTIEGDFSTALSGNDLKLGSLYFFEGETTKKYTMYIWIEYQENKEQISMLNKSMNATLFVKAQDVKTKDACDTRSNFKITYVLNGGTGKESEEVVKGGSVTLYTPTITDSGLSFGGWYSDSSMTKKVTSLSDINDDIKLYAMWSCTFDGELVQGAEYVNGQYTYRYMQEGDRAYSGLYWENIEDDGWGVQLTNKISTSTVTSKLCTYVNNKPVISMSYMFDNSAATTLDLSSFNTSNVTNMRYMFSYSSATTLDLSNFNTSNVTNMEYMFHNTSVVSLDLSSFDVSNVTNMDDMFSSSALTSIDLSSFDTSKVTSMRWMFYNNTSLKTIYVSGKFNTNAVTSSASMFSDSINLVGGAGTVYDSNYTDKTYARIDGGTSSPGYFTAK